MIIKCVALGNANEAFIERRFIDGVNIIFSDDNNKGKTLVMQGMMYAMGNQPIFPKGFEYHEYYFYCKVEIDNEEIEFLRKGNSFVVKKQDYYYTFDNVTELKYFLSREHILNIPQINKNNQLVLVDLSLFYELFFIGQDKRNPSNIIISGHMNKKDFFNMLCDMIGYPVVDIEEISTENKNKIQHIKLEIAKTRKMMSLLKKNPDVSVLVDKYSSSEKFDSFRMKIKKIYDEISEFDKKRYLELNRKQKLEALVHELNSLNREIEQGNVVCAECGSDKIIYKNHEISFEVSNEYVRKQILSSIAYQIMQKEELIQNYKILADQLRDKLKYMLKDSPADFREVLLLSETIISDIDYDNELQQLNNQLKELQTNNKEINDSAKEAKLRCKEMKMNIVKRMNDIYREVDPHGKTFFDDIFTKKDETYSGSEEQEYYYSRVLAINDYFNHPYPLLIDCYRSGEISTYKEDIMIKNFIARKKQVIITSTLKKEEYTMSKYDDYKENANIIDYSRNQSSKLLQSQYVESFKKIVESFGVIFENYN